MSKYRMMGMKKGVPKSVDEYIAAQPEAVVLRINSLETSLPVLDGWSSVINK